MGTVPGATELYQDVAEAEGEERDAFKAWLDKEMSGGDAGEALVTLQEAQAGLDEASDMLADFGEHYA